MSYSRHTGAGSGRGGIGVYGHVGVAARGRVGRGDGLVRSLVLSPQPFSILIQPPSHFRRRSLPILLCSEDAALDRVLEAVQFLKISLPGE